jgi:TonB family protein
MVCALLLIKAILMISPIFLDGTNQFSGLPVNAHGKIEVVIIPQVEAYRKTIEIKVLDNKAALPKFGTQYVAGKPVPVPDFLISSKNEYSIVEELYHSLSTPGYLNIDDKSDDMMKNLGASPAFSKPVPSDEIPPDSAYIVVEELPRFDVAELRNNIVYPYIAIRTGTEGQVMVRIYIDETGKLRRMFVQSSPSILLNDAAMDAIRKTTFTPAVMNGNSVGCWVSIPIAFKLKKCN